MKQTQSSSHPSSRFATKRHLPISRLKKAANTATTTPSATYYPSASLDEGVRAAADAHELVCSLRSEVSALERHHAALEAKLWRLEDISVSTVDEAAPAAAAMPVAATTKHETKAPADATEGAETPAAPGTPPRTTRSEKARRRAVRAEKRKRAAAVLRQAFLHRDEPGGSMQAHAPAVAGDPRAEDATLSSMATTVEHTREARQRAQEAFVSRRVNEMERGLEGSPRGP